MNTKQIHPDVLTLKHALREEAALRRAWKAWDRRRPELKTDPCPLSDAQRKLGPRRATFLCILMAHSRRRVHLQGQDLTTQSATILELLLARGCPLSPEEQALARRILEWAARPERTAA